MRQIMSQLQKQNERLAETVRALQQMVPQPHTREDEEEAEQMRRAAAEFAERRKQMANVEPPKPVVPDPSQVFDARLRSVEVALNEIREYMARSVTTVTQQPPPSPAPVVAPPMFPAGPQPAFYNPQYPWRR